jgi:UDP-N-acetylglucosamine--N-acetylmuramyl-(pentapeptide) pyrophosphoryl-undecaprenol N-acetylglucosamine transferase
MKRKSTVFIIGGHLTPAQAIYDGIKNKKNLKIFFVGIKHTILFDKSLSQEYQFAKKNNITFLPLNTGKLYRFLSIKGIISFLKIPIGFFQAFYYVVKYRPKIIISFGSYVSVPVVFWGGLFRVKVFTHEQASIPGLASRITSVFSNTIFTTWKDTEKYFKKISLRDKNIIFTGNILREEIFKSNTENFKFNKKLPILYITGGNQGSHIINQIIFKNIKKLLKQYNIIHQTGSNTIFDDYKKALQLKETLPAILRARYIIRRGIWGDEIGEVFRKTDIIISRAGANTVYEILTLNKKAILIPISSSSFGEQYENAKIARKYSDTISIISESSLSFNTLNTELKKLQERENTKKIDLPRNASKIIIQRILKNIA